MLKITTNPKQFEDFSKDYDLIKLAVDYVSLKKGKIIYNRLLESSFKYLNLNIDTDDIVINNAQKLANKIGNNLKKLSDSTVIYATKVEPAYLVLEKQLDAFKKTEDDYKELCTDGPILNDDTKDDRVYEIDFINENPYMNEKVIINWQNLIQEYEKKLDSMVDNIHNIKKQLQSVGDSDFNDILASGINMNLPDSISYDMNFQNSNQLNNNFGYYLYGTELKKFLKDNNVPNESYVLVYKDMVTINEVNFPIYKVYDREDSQESTFQYEEYVKKCLYYESKIDEAVLDKLAKGGTSLVFEQTYRCDGGSLIKGHFNAAAYCNSLNRNVVQFFNPYSFEYNARAIVHETGHAYDFTIRNNLIGDYGCGITALNNDNLVNTKLSNEQISDLFLVDSNGNSLTWDKIIKDEVNCFDSTMDYTRPCIIDRFKTQEEAQKFFENKCLGGSMVSLSQQEDKWILKVAYTNPKDELGLGVTVNNSSSLYNVHDYVSSPHEYFADSFAAYYIGDDKARFEYLCPETYKTLDRIIKKDINDYKNGGRL